jgi:hypothetical protein
VPVERVYATTPQMKFTSPNTEKLSKPISVRLPASIYSAWGNTVGNGDDGAFFARWAIAAFMLREGFVAAEDCPMLPFKVFGPKGQTYQLASTADEAIEFARAEGFEVAQVEAGWR